MAIRRQKSPQSDKTANADLTESTGSSHGELLHQIDDLLDEIDEALESNAEEFVRNYVQKGGE